MSAHRLCSSVPPPLLRLVRTALAAGLSVAGAALIVGCGTAAPVRPWQHEHLTRPALTFDDGLETRFRQHMLTAREGAEGGTTHAGGGCGCN